MTHVIAGVPVRAPRTTIYPMLRRGRPRKHPAQQITAVDAVRLLVAELARRYVRSSSDYRLAAWKPLFHAVELMEVLEGSGNAD